MTRFNLHGLLRRTVLLGVASLAGAAHAQLIGFEAENGASVTTSVSATLGSDFTPAQSDAFALGGEYLARSGNGETGGFPGNANNLLSYDVDFAAAGEYDLYARLLYEVDGSDDSFYYGNGFGVKSLSDSADWVRPNGLPDAGFPAATYFWINLSEDIGLFPSGSPTTFNVAAPGTQTIQFGGREDGLYFDAFAFGASSESFTDQQLNESVTNVFSPPNEWNLAGGGDFNTAASWSDNVVPAFDALFGNSITQDAEIALDSPAPSLNSVTFNNSGFQYTLAGPNPLTLVAAAQISTTGSHTITADVAGSAGLTKLGDGTLSLPGATSYTGDTDIQAGTLVLGGLDSIDNQAGSSLNIAAGATATFSAGASGVLATELTGASTGTDSTVRFGGGSDPSDTIAINRSNASYAGVIRVDGGTLAVSNNNALGAAGVSNNRTVVQAGSTGRLELTGGVTIANEVLDFEGRTTEDAALSSTGNNTWNGVIRGEGGRVLNIESNSGTLTLNSLYAEDSTRIQNYVFSGAGNTTITNRLSDGDIDVDTGIVTVKSEDNVGVIKRGSGTLRIDYATTVENDYWFGPTTIEEGTLSVAASGGTDGELRTSSIDIRSGATLDVSDYTEYTQQIGQALRGSGAINVGSGNLRLIDVSSVAPGDSPGAVGELTVSSGTVTLPDLFLGGGGAWAFDIGNNEPGSTSDVLNVANGSFTAGTSGITLNVTAANGHLDAGSRTIVTHTGGTNPVLNGVSAQITDANGNALTTRQSVSVNGNTAGQVNVVVAGEETSRTWGGSVSSEWDVSTSNWQGGDQQFRDLDHVTFNDTASTTDVTLAANRSPGSVTFANSVAYNLTGEGGIVGSGDINVTGSGQVTLANTGNNFSGDTTISSGSSLRMAAATTGSIVNSGTLSLGVEQSTTLIVQDGLATIGSGQFRVLAFEAEDFQSSTVNASGFTEWAEVSGGNAPAGSADGEALQATLGPGNGDPGTNGANFVTYDLRFTEPGTYYWYSKLASIDIDGDLDFGNNDSFFLPLNDLDSENTDPSLPPVSRIENDGTGVINEERGPIDKGTLDWVRSGDQGGQADDFRLIEVTQADVDAGTTFSFKAATREQGMTLDRWVFVANPDFDTDPDFGTLTDGDLDAAVSIASSNVNFTPAGTVLNVNGDFTMTASGTLNLLLSGPNTHDQLDISGVLNADGVLSIGEGGEGFAAAEGDVFDIFRFDSATGAFDDILLPTLNAGLGWDSSQLLVTGELFVVASPLLPGDANGDGNVDLLDLDILGQNFGLMGGATVAQGDFNGDGNVDLLDLDILGQNFGAMSSSSTAVPEPRAILLALLSVGWAARRPGRG